VAQLQHMWNADDYSYYRMIEEDILLDIPLIMWKAENSD